MRTLKILLGAVTLPLLALVGLGFFLPSQWYAERALMMDVPPAAFATYLAGTENWAELGPWSTEGKLTVVSTEPGKGLEFTLEGGGWGQLSRGFLAVAPIGKRTRVSLGASGKLLTFLGRYAQPLYEMNVGKDLEEALRVLRQRVHAPEKTGPSSLVVEPGRVADQPPVPSAELEARHKAEERSSTETPEEAVLSPTGEDAAPVNPAEEVVPAGNSESRGRGESPASAEGGDPKPAGTQRPEGGDPKPAGTQRPESDDPKPIGRELKPTGDEGSSGDGSSGAPEPAPSEAADPE